jgi:hypothetical protein
MNNTESPGPVVVGIDGSDASIGAAQWAAKEAVHQDVPLRLVYVIQITDGPIASADRISPTKNMPRTRCAPLVWRWRGLACR